MKKINDNFVKIPKVSAVIFFYNNEGVFELIKVALNQINKFNSVIVFDDGSVDHFHKKFLKIYSNNVNIIYHRQIKNRGIPLAMKSAIDKVNADYFYLMSCGDIYEDHILKDFNALNWEEIHPGIIASGIYTRKEFSYKKSLYIQNTKKYKVYSGKEYNVLAYKHANLFYGGGCIINTKLGLEASKYFEDLEWAADYFMYYYAGFMSGVIFTNSAIMCNVLHKLRYCDTYNNENNIKIVSAFIRSTKDINLEFYNFCYKSAILPVHSFFVLFNLFFSLEFRRYVSFYLIYKCIFTDLGKIFKIFIPFRLKKYLRLHLSI
jgi:glycosyltransferase involved in cell wall biosynthesis